MTDADPADAVDTLRKRLRGRGEDARYVQYEPDRRHLLQMSDNIRLVPSEVGHHRHEKILRHNARIAQLAQPPTIEDFTENDEADTYGIESEEDIRAVLTDEGLLGLSLESFAASEAVVRWIHDEYTNEHTNQDYRTCFRSFGRYRLKVEDPPASLDWIPTGTSNDFDPVPSERDLLKWEGDVVPMIDATHNPRDSALFAVAFEAGLRGGELFDLRVGDIFDAEHTVGLHVDGKEGERSIHLITSVPYLQQWQNKHPGDEDDYLWSKLSTAERPSYNTFLQYFKSAAERAGVSKTVTPTNFRKSNTRWLVKLGFSQPRIEDRQGRKRGSEHTARYMARFGSESNEKEYARLHGYDVETDADEVEIGPVPCPRCHRDTPRHEDQCVWCHFALSHDAVDEQVEQDNDFIASAADAPAPEETAPEEASAEDVMEAKRVIDANPALRRVLSLD